MKLRNSETHPLRVDWIEASPAHGRIGMTFCPGKIQSMSLTGGWQRDLDLDLATLVKQGATHVMCLLEPHELDTLRVPNLPAKAKAAGLAYFELPIRDVHPPAQTWRAAWDSVREEILEACQSGRLVVFCQGGLGRTGLYAAILLQELGMAADEAVALVRQVRPGAIETEQQLAYVMQFKAGEPEHVNSMGGGIGDDDGDYL